MLYVHAMTSVVEAALASCPTGQYCINVGQTQRLPPKFGENAFSLVSVSNSGRRIKCIMRHEWTAGKYQAFAEQTSSHAICLVVQGAALSMT